MSAPGRKMSLTQATMLVAGNMEFSHYAEVPNSIANELIAKSKS